MARTRTLDRSLPIRRIHVSMLDTREWPRGKGLHEQPSSPIWTDRWAPRYRFNSVAAAGQRPAVDASEHGARRPEPHVGAPCPKVAAFEGCSRATSRSSLNSTARPSFNGPAAGQLYCPAALLTRFGIVSRRCRGRVGPGSGCRNHVAKGGIRLGGEAARVGPYQFRTRRRPTRSSSRQCIRSPTRDDPPSALHRTSRSHGASTRRLSSASAPHDPLPG